MRADIIELPRRRDASPAAARPPVRPAGVLAYVAVLQAVVFGTSFLLDGFYHFAQWALVALLSTTALVAVLLVAPVRSTRSGALMVLGLGALAAWAALSVLWAESAENAWREAARFGLYAVTVALALTVVRSSRAARRVIDTLTLAMAGFVVYVLVRLVAGGAGTMFISHRLHEPLGYINGQAGLLLMAFWLLFAAGEQARRPAFAGLLLAIATGAAQLLVLTGSRVVLPALALSVLLVIALQRGRLRRSGALLLIFAGTLVTLPALFDVLDHAVADSRPADGVLRTAGLVGCLAAASVGAAWATALTLARRVTLTARLRRAAGLGLVALVVTAGVAVATTHDPVGRAQDEVAAFRNLGDLPLGSSRLISGGGYRYDLWRVALDEFRRDPLRGAGAGNYATAFMLHRRSPQIVRQPHSIELQALGELGVPGAIFLLVFLAGAASAIWSARAADRRLAVAGAGAGSAWMLHTSIDWLHILPGVTGIALLCFVALTVAGRDRADVEPARRSDADATRRVVLVAALCALALFAAVVGRLYAADHLRRAATDAIARDPGHAAHLADRALRIDGELLDAYYAKAGALARQGDYGGARETLLTAVEREPRNYVPHILLADLATRRGDESTARRHHRLADRLNPYDARLVPPAP